MRARLYQSLLTAMAGMAFFTAAPALAQAKSDLNGDGKADIVWRHQPADATAIWYMNGASATGSSSFPAFGAGFSLGAVGDINGDGYPDLVLRDTTNGTNRVWFTNHGGALWTTVDTTPVADQNWKIAGASDFNWDGFDDLVWRNYATGANSIWYMRPWATLVSTASLPAVTDLNWYLGGVADFDNNGYPDLVWHHNATGQNTLWMMGGTDGTTLVSTKALPSSAAVVRPEAVADYTGDGCIDIIFRNSSTGANELWTFSCAVSRLSVTPMAAVADLNWKIGVH